MIATTRKPRELKQKDAEEAARILLKKAADAPLDATKILRSLCRKSFYDFVKEFWHTIIPEKPRWNWHIKYLCRVMQKMAERVFRGEKKKYDLVVNISPGTTKSTICSVMFIAWVWTRMPSARFICCSYAERLALQLSRRCRELIKSDLYQRCFPEIQFKEDQDTKSAFANTKGGERYAVGSRGNVMGNHGHFIIIDDPVDPESVLSEVELENVNRWIIGTLSGRKVEKSVSVTILVMQRLHQSDPTAEMLKQEKIRHIKIPATLEFDVHPPELKAYYEDGLMDPVRLSREVLEEIRKKPRGEYVYAGQYGQNPVPLGGGMFKTDRLHYGPPPAKLTRIVRFWDKAGTMAKGMAKRPGGSAAGVNRRGAFTVGLKMGRDSDGRIWILDVIRVQVDSFAREKLIRKTARHDGYGVVIGLEEEPGSGGIESAENTVRRLMGFNVKVIKPKGDKELRAEPFSVQVNAGHVCIAPGHWNEDYVEEMKFFPLSTYMDQIDASSGAFTCLVKGRIRIGGLRSS